MTPFLRTFLLPLAVLVWLANPVVAFGEVVIPDPGLNAAVRGALQIPSGPLTEQDLLTLTNLSAGGLSITNVAGLEAAHNLRILDLDNNSIATFPIADALTNLTILDLYGNQLTRFALTSASSQLTILDVAFNSLSECTLPAGLTNLNTLFLEGNSLTKFPLPGGLTQLAQLDLSSNQLTSLTLPPDSTHLTALFLTGNPLTTFVLPELLAATNLTGVVVELQNQGIPVYPYPSAVQLTLPQQQPVGAFRFGITGPPGVYAVYDSTNVNAWAPLNFVNNPLGGIFFLDPEAHLSSQKFYRAGLQTPPANMVFLPPGTFLMGSPTNDLDSSSDERPQTTVTLTHGFWIGQYEVTQGEYLSLMHTNPSYFPGDLTRAVSSVSWYDATNYCAQLTARELAAGHIAPGSRYRLPTEAEWEYAARAGSTNRFSYGDDPNYSSLPDHAWLASNAGLMVHPVGQKLPNPSGLYDMEGNVWEWCQDWYGPLPGGNQIDPTGPVTAANGLKVMRGGAYDYFDSDCRSARRLFYTASSFFTDTDLGFRVVLVAE